MTSSRNVGQDRNAYVWVWLPATTMPVVAGVLAPTGAFLQNEPVLAFRYAASYLNRSDAITLWNRELPLSSEVFDPTRSTTRRDPLAMASCLRDGAPDSWGRRVVNLSLGADPSRRVDEVTYLLSSGSNRIGALDFQASPRNYVSRDDGATLEQLMSLAEIVEAGEAIPESLTAAALHGTSVGGARPKALLTDGSRQLIAKFSSSDDDSPAVQTEALAMLLADRAGLSAAAVEVRNVIGKDVLLVERFDRARIADGSVGRRGMLSMLTVLGLRAAGSWGASYADIAQEVRTGPWDDVAGTLSEMFTRLVFNILVGNNDDHLRNHAAFWNGKTLVLTPAYDIAPPSRALDTSSQAIAITRDGQRASQLRLAVEVAAEFHLTPRQAKDVIDKTRSSIETHWDECADLARLTRLERASLWGRQFLNPYIDYDEA